MSNKLSRDVDLAIRGKGGDRVVEASLSSETPVYRSSLNGYEILSHADGAIDLSRAPLPLIVAHDQRAVPVGVIESLRVVGKKLRGVLRFGNSARASELLDDIEAGVLRSISIGYEILSGHFEADRYIVDLWRPLEASLVAVPADPNVGIGRAYSSDSPGETIMQKPTSLGAAMFRQERNAREPGERAAYAQLGRELAGALTGGGQYGPAWLGLSEKDMSNFSVQRGVLAAAGGSVANTFEGEISAEIAKRIGSIPNPHGFYLPLDIQLRDMTAAGTSGSNYLVGTQTMSFLDMVRNRSVAMRLGATLIDNMTGSATIPRISADSTAYWLSSESVPLTESQPTIGQLSLSPKLAGAYTEISRLMAKQAPGVDSLLLATLAGSVGVAIDTAAIAGSGASGQPTGIANTAGVGTFSGTSLGWAGLIEAQADVIGGAEVDPALCGYVTTAAVAQTLMGRQRFTGTDSPLWQGAYGDGIIAGCRALASGNVPTATMVLGHWPSLVIANWGVIQVEANPYANFAAGIMGIRVMAAVDIAVRRASDFSVATSIT